jgi:predicted TIM-barrel fold metal-dependent hydrolase
MIDAFPHCLPRNCLERFCTVASPVALGILNTHQANERLAPLWDLDRRFRIMDLVPEFTQVLTICVPPIEIVAQGQVGIDLARLTNDSMAELVQKHPDRFRGFAASLCLTEVDASLAEIDRALGDLGALGIQIFTNVAGLPLDEPRFEPLFARMEELGKPIWVHGWRSPTVADYRGEEDSRFGLWLSFGWPYEMSMFMARMALSGMLERHPGLRMLTHHSGGMVPTMGRRASGGPTTPMQGQDRATIAALAKPALEYLKMFYADTTGQSPIAINAAMQFFGRDRVLMGTDFPWFYPADHLQALDQLQLSPAEREALLGGNAKRVLGVR